MGIIFQDFASLGFCQLDPVRLLVVWGLDVNVYSDFHIVLI